VLSADIHNAVGRQLVYRNAVRPYKGGLVGAPNRGATRGESLPSHCSYSDGDNKVSTKKRPEEGARSSVKDQVHKPAGDDSAHRTSDDMGVRAKMKATNRGKADQSK
jgi:hypothetical protein